MQTFTLAVKNGLVADGTGAPLQKTNIYVSGTKIAKITPEDLPAERVIDAAGHIAAPGFIDMHTHSDGSPFSAPGFESCLHQGVTACIGGNCGSSPVPRAPLDDKGNARWHTVPGYLAAATGACADNIGTLTGHGTLRNRCMADPRRTLPTPEELRAMQDLLRAQLEEGSFGLSCGLEYVPGLYAETEELIALGRVTAEYDRLMAFHMRNEDVRVEEAVDEVLRIARESGVHVHISHLKVEYAEVPGRLQKILDKIEKARAEGLRVTMDVYPYAACSTSFSPQLPPDMRIPVAEAVKLYADDAAFDGLRPYVEAFFRRRQGPEKIGIAYTAGVHPELDGLTFDKAAERLGLSVVDAYRKIMVDCRFRVTAIYYAMEESDVLTLLRRPDVSVISDSTATDFRSGTVKGVPHPRAFGSFARFLRLNREYKLLPWEQAIQKITSLPADTLGIADRGRLLEGNFADIAVFNPETVGDTGTYTAPAQQAVGFLCTVLNGQIAMENGTFTGCKSGMGLRAR